MVFKLFLSPVGILLLWQILKFDAYFQEDVPLSAEEHYRIRQVGIYYYLEDDSMTVIEPVVQNSGLPQGRLIRRHRVPKNDRGDHYHWKDLNRGMNITMYGRTYRIVDCDPFTQVCCLNREHRHKSSQELQVARAVRVR